MYTENLLLRQENELLMKQNTSLKLVMFGMFVGVTIIFFMI